MQNNERNFLVKSSKKYTKPLKQSELIPGYKFIRGFVAYEREQGTYTAREVNFLSHA